MNADAYLGHDHDDVCGSHDHDHDYDVHGRDDDVYGHHGYGAHTFFHNLRCFYSRS